MTNLKRARILIDRRTTSSCAAAVKGCQDGPGPGAARRQERVPQSVGPVAVPRNTARGRAAHHLLDFGYTAEALVNNIGLMRRRSGQDQCADRQPRPLRSFRRPAWASSTNIAACCRPISSSMPAARIISASGCRRPDSRPVQPTSACSTAANSPRRRSRRALRNADVDRRPRLHHRQDQALQHRKNSSEHACRIRDEGRARLQCHALHAGGTAGKIVPDEHIHEHATCFNLQGKGLVVISSCGHVGIVNSVRQAQEVSGVQKVHAMVGGFHLGPGAARLSQADRRRDEEARSGRRDPDALQRPQLHAGGASADAGQLITTSTGSRLTFSA